MLANLNDVLKPARENKKAVGLFNTCSLELARGVMEAAEELQVPVIIGTAEILLPVASLEIMADLLLLVMRPYNAVCSVVAHVVDHVVQVGAHHSFVGVGPDESACAARP